MSSPGEAEIAPDGDGAGAVEHALVAAPTVARPERLPAASTASTPRLLVVPHSRFVKVYVRVVAPAVPAAVPFAYAA